LLAVLGFVLLATKVSLVAGETVPEVAIVTVRQYHSKVAEKRAVIKSILQTDANDYKQQ